MATICNPKNQRAWHSWALMNYQVLVVVAVVLALVEDVMIIVIVL